jgi:hypothetical protein
MLHECPNCKKKYQHSDDDFARLFNGGHIYVVCKCHPDKGLKIIVGGKKVKNNVDLFSPALDIFTIKPKSFEGRKIIEEENPPVRVPIKLKHVVGA